LTVKPDPVRRFLGFRPIFRTEFRSDVFETEEFYSKDSTFRERCLFWTSLVIFMIFLNFPNAVELQRFGSFWLFLEQNSSV